MRYFKCYSESNDGDEGLFYCEVEDGAIVRHVSVFGDILYWATPTDEFDEVYAFTDQPDFDPSERDVEIERGEFLALWSAALRQGETE
jgi:hypothetical protein